jgi:uncharacterized membrane protein
VFAIVDGYTILKVVHVLAAITWVGGAITTNILGTRITRSGDDSRLVAFGYDVEWIGSHVYLPSTLIVLLFGILTALRGHYSFTNAWLIVGLVGIVLTGITGSTFLGPELKRIAQIFETRGTGDAEGLSRLRRLIVVARVDLVVLVIVVLDMVFKPGFH